MSSLIANHSTISECRNYVSIISKDNTRLEIYDLASMKLYRSYDLYNIVRKYLFEVSNMRKKLDSLVISQVKWEEILENQISSKLGLVINNYSLLVILDIRFEYTDPIVVQQTRVEGIENFQWIRPTSESEESGAYINSKQFVVFTKGYLEMKLFSVDCTSIILQLLKPAMNEVIFRPKAHSRIWSIAAQPIHSSTPILYHFYNEGSSSTLLFEFELPRASKFNLKWSNSGKWISFFNDQENLFGFTMKIYNSLGVFQNLSRQQLIPKGNPIVSIDWFNEGIYDNRDESNRIIEIGALKYVNKWITVRDCDYILIASAGEFEEMELVLISGITFKILKRFITKFSDITDTWKESREGKMVKYRRVAHKTYRRKHDIEDMIVFKSLVCLKLSDCILAYSLGADDQNNVGFHFELSVEFNSKLKSVRFYGENSTKLLMTCDDHLAIYDFKHRSLERVYESSSPISNSYIVSDDDSIAVEKHLSDSKSYIGKWEVVNITNSKPKGLHDKTRLSIGAPRRESGSMEPSRLKRNRFDDKRISLVDSSGLDEFTDTFKLRKRLKSK
ncbi:uncharacterized protein PRCAT00005573001 [Priceomyces carsonii]|uniref:uncharacterized protein n=1 Tax=Priceomyces carsonii TaxID=28549 RepID=UPI002ED8793D|nr:unnamed protein product [Priceomyces carsonii]